MPTFLMLHAAPASPRSSTREPLRRLLFLPALLLLLFPLLACRPEGAPAKGQEAQIPVRSEVAERQSFRSTRTLLGRIEPAQRTRILLPEGGVISYPARFAGGLRTGEKVAKGERLATIENLDRNQALLEAEIQERSARAAAERVERTVAAGVAPEAELERARFELEKAVARLDGLRRSHGQNDILAPAAGILRLEAGAPPPGSRLQAGELLAELASDDHLDVELFASAQDLEVLEVGALARCRLPGASEVRGEGRLHELDGLLDEAGLARGRVRITLDRGLPRAGSGVEIDIEGPELNAITVPESALVRRGGVATLFLLENRGTGYLARARAVALGPRGAGRVVVQSGILPGERVAIEGADLLSEGALAVEVSPAPAGARP